MLYTWDATTVECEVIGVAKGTPCNSCWGCGSPGNPEGTSTGIAECGSQNSPGFSLLSCCFAWASGIIFLFCSSCQIINIHTCGNLLISTLSVSLSKHFTQTWPLVMPKEVVFCDYVQSSLKGESVRVTTSRAHKHINDNNKKQKSLTTKVKTLRIHVFNLSICTLTGQFLLSMTFSLLDIIILTLHLIRIQKLSPLGDRSYFTHRI